MRTAEAARYLGLSVALLRKWRLRGAGDPGKAGPPYSRVGPTVVLYTVADLDAWLKQHRTVH